MSDIDPGELMSSGDPSPKNSPANADPEEDASRLGDGEGLEIADPADFSIQRDGEGDIIPIKQKIPGTDKAVLVRPLHGGAVEEYSDVLEGENADDDRVDSFLREHIVRGPGQNGIGDLHDYVVPALIQAVKNSSGHDLFIGAQEQRSKEVAANMRMMEAMGVDLSDKMGELMAEEMDEE